MMNGGNAKWRSTQEYIRLCLVLLEADDKRGVLDYDDLMIELKALGAHFLTHPDLYSPQGYRMLTLAAFFGLPVDLESFDFTRNIGRIGKLTRRSIEYQPSGDITKWFPDENGENGEPLSSEETRSNPSSRRGDE